MSVDHLFHVTTSAVSADLTHAGWIKTVPTSFRDNVQWLITEVEHQREIIDKLPKCWTLRGGVLIQDCPVVPMMKLSVLANFGAGKQIYDLIAYDITAFGASDGDRFHWAHTQSADSPEAALALRERSDDG